MTDTNYEVVTRYEGPGPDVATMCLGQCEGTGFYPQNVNDPEMTTWEREQVVQKRAAGEEPDEVGCYWITCEDCGGTGKRTEGSVPPSFLEDLKAKASVADRVATAILAADLHLPTANAEYPGGMDMADVVTLLCREVKAVRAGDLLGLPQSLRDVHDERARQISQEGWTPKHDDGHRDGQLAGAAACYVLTSVPTWNGKDSYNSTLWPWDRSWWKPTTPRRDLVKAAALILAEIERLDRAETQAAALPVFTEPPVNNGFRLYWVQEWHEIYAARSADEARAYVESLTGESIPADEVGEVTTDMPGDDGEGGTTTLFNYFANLVITEPTQLWSAYA